MILPKGISQRDIADHLGISISTVSRALNDNPRVSQLTRNAVKSAIEELSSTAQVEDPNVPMMIGITHSHSSDGMTDHQHESVLDQVLGGVEVACRAYDAVPYPWQQSHLLSSDESIPFYSRISGVIMSGGEVDEGLIRSIKANDKPIVIIGGHVPGAGIPSVAADSFDGMYQATRHLAGLGHSRIALVNGPNTTYTSREKRAGYLTALADSGITFDPHLLVFRLGTAGFSDHTAEQLTRQLLSLDSPPTAMIFATDAMARAGYRVCRHLGLSIPGDISVVGFHDDDAAYAYPPLTTVRVNRYDWGVAAVEELMRIVQEDKKRESRLLLPVKLVVRASTGPC
ncbi:MAG TPA: LacI family DNA-binding transcriptional regulator, partial [Thermomicrobiales bacterium]|nr:LacI family DNA-binding transcriptional regulator [Thermomicrobiales bacterium]